MREVNAVPSATDFSEHAHQAVDTEATHARSSGARIEVVHGFQTPVPIVSPYEVVVPKGFVERARGGAAKSLRSVVEGKG